MKTEACESSWEAKPRAGGGCGPDREEASDMHFCIDYADFASQFSDSWN